MRFPRIVIFCLGLLLSTPAAAQTVDSTGESFALSQGGTVPPYVVPVLRLVSSTHVEPTTGFVLSETGLVMVPSGFASEGDEIVVLDGGTDIIAHGRTARIERDFPMDGVQVLSVYGLQREPAPFSETGLADGDALRLTAFPPAEQIAEGAPPLDIAATVTVFGENRQPAVSGETPLPNVTGPLLDGCGNVAAYSIARDIQTMETSPGTRYQWRRSLLGVMQRLGVRPAPSACLTANEPAPAEAEAEATDAESPEESPAVEPAVPETEAGAEAPEEAVEETTQEPEAPAEAMPAVLPPIETDSGDEAPAPADPPAADPGRKWAWLLLAALLLAAGAALHRWRRAPGDGESAGVDEPDESPPVAGEPEEADTNLDSRLLLKGALADGTTIDCSCAVSLRAVNVTIGRGQADLVIESAAVSRLHAALNGAADELTLTDLGSNNGSFINDVPCLEGEIMYLQAGDSVTLGDARFTVEFFPATGEGVA